MSPPIGDLVFSPMAKTQQSKSPRGGNQPRRYHVWDIRNPDVLQEATASSNYGAKQAVFRLGQFPTAMHLLRAKLA